MIVLVVMLGVVLLLAGVNYVAYFFGIDIAGLGGPSEAHDTHARGAGEPPPPTHTISESPAHTH